MPSARQVLRFRVELRDISPTIWRTFEIDAASHFWDLHVAIQGAMGWQDCHLHAFRIGRGGTADNTLIGIPEPDPFPGSPPVLAGWEIPLWRHFQEPGDRALYDYDFGDGWEHGLVLEAIVPRQIRTKYPRFLAGEQACPPEDCGGPPGYDELLEVIADDKHPEHARMLGWLGGPFDPTAFNPSQVRFADSKKRLKRVKRLFGEGG